MKFRRNRSRGSTAIALVLYLALVSKLHSDIIFVDATAGGVNNGTSWTDAFPNLQDALAASLADDEIFVAAGIYKPTPGGDRCASFALVDSVALYGGFNGSETLLSERNPDPVTNATFLSGDLLGDDGPDFTYNEDNSYHVLTSIAVSNGALLDGFTVSGGNANDASFPNDRGGGMLNRADGNPSVKNILFTSNYAGFGGGMANDFGTPVIDNVLFVNNSADSGGGMLNSFSDATITNAQFFGNTAVLRGGGIYNAGASPTIVNAVFSGNSGGVRGGAIANLSSANPTIINGTFASNSSTLQGGAFYNFGDSFPLVKNSVFWGNLVGSTPKQIFGDPLNAGSAFNLIEGGYAAVPAAVISTVDPLFVDPDGADNTEGTADDDLHLAQGSPAVNLGDNAAIFESLDLDGNPRIHGNIIDLGPYESVFLTFVAEFPVLDPEADANGNGLTNYHDYAAGLDPSSPFDPSAFARVFNGSQGELFFEFTGLTDGNAVFTEYQKSTSISS